METKPRNSATVLQPQIHRRWWPRCNWCPVLPRLVPAAIRHLYKFICPERRKNKSSRIEFQGIRKLSPAPESSQTDVTSMFLPDVCPTADRTGKARLSEADRDRSSRSLNRRKLSVYCKKCTYNKETDFWQIKCVHIWYYIYSDVHKLRLR